MNNESVQRELGFVVNNWTNTRNVAISPQAINFLIMVVMSIDEDPHPLWERYQVSSAQREAISIIPTVLDEVNKDRLLMNRKNKRLHPEITSWDIWHSMGRFAILDKFCFIPKDI